MSVKSHIIKVRFCFNFQKAVKHKRPPPQKKKNNNNNNKNKKLRGGRQFVLKKS